MRETTRSEELYARAQTVIAGGVSSDARRVPPGQVPLYVDRAKGSALWDVDGNQYVDYVLGRGPVFLGHSAPSVIEAVVAQLERGQVYAAQHELEIEVAELVCELVPGVELVRFNSVGSEAVHGAWRIARGLTGRQRILKFEGHYHGWFDPLLVSVHPAVDEAGSADRPKAVLQTGGQAESVLGDLVVAPWNDIEAFEAIFAEHSDEIAAVVMEPVLCNTGCILPDAEFLHRVRKLTREADVVLIFDEVITGFRLAAGGAQEWLGVDADLVVFGKAIANGFPLSCVAGSREFMEPVVAGVVGHAGTFNSNPVVMAAARATLTEIRDRKETLYPAIRERTRALTDGLSDIADRAGQPLNISSAGTVIQTSLTDLSEIRNYRDFVSIDPGRARRLHAGLLEQGISIVPAGLWLMSAALDDSDISRTLEAFEAVLSDPDWHGDG